MTWTNERVETLKAMWNEGKSASQIAKELGGITRNAVIGKVHRLGLSNRVVGPAAVPRPDGPEPVEDATERPDAAEPASNRTEGDSDMAEMTAPRSPGPDPAEIADDPPASPAERMPTRPRPAAVPPMQPAQSEISAEALASLAEVERNARRLSLMELTERTCKWPVGDPATDDFWFCGLPSAPGKPYCEVHVTIAFQPMSARRDRRSGGR